MLFVSRISRTLKVHARTVRFPVYVYFFILLENEVFWCVCEGRVCVFTLWLLGISVALGFHEVTILVKLCSLPTPASFPLIKHIDSSSPLLILVKSYWTYIRLERK